MKKLSIVLLILPLLVGCLSPKGAQDNNTVVSPPIINLPPLQVFTWNRLIFFVKMAWMRMIIGETIVFRI